MMDALRGWALGTSGGDIEHILRTSDAGRTWTDVTPPEPAPEASTPLGFLPFFYDEMTAWAVPSMSFGSSPAGPANVWRTTDGGVIWQWSADLRATDIMVEGWAPSYMTFVDRERGWLMVAVGAGAGHAYIVIFRTTDGGASWERLIDPYSEDSASLHTCCQSGLSFTDSNSGLVPLADNNYMRIVVNWTADGGATWTSSFPPPPASAPNLFDRSSCAVSSTAVLPPEDIRLGVRCRVFDGRADENYVYTTGDQGETWTVTSFPGGALLFFNAAHGVALDRNLYQTDDAGASWTKIKSVNWDGQFSFVSEDLGWAVARSGDEIALVRTADGGRTWEEIEATIAP